MIIMRYIGNTRFTSWFEVSSERSVGPDGSPCCSVRPVQLAARHGYCSCGPTQLHAVISPPTLPSTLLPAFYPALPPIPAVSSASLYLQPSKEIWSSTVAVSQLQHTLSSGHPRHQLQLHSPTSTYLQLPSQLQSSKEMGPPQLQSLKAFLSPLESSLQPLSLNPASSHMPPKSWRPAGLPIPPFKTLNRQTLLSPSLVSESEFVLTIPDCFLSPFGQVPVPN